LAIYKSIIYNVTSNDLTPISYQKKLQVILIYTTLQLVK